MKQIQFLFPSDDPYFIINQLIQNLCLLYFAHLIDTQILTDDEQTKLFELVNKQLDNESNIEWKLLYRASRDGFGREDFYSKCNGRNDIICIIQSEQNNVFGGYQSVKCDKERADESVKYDKMYEDDPSAFIYKISLADDLQAKVEIFPVQNNGREAIQHYQSGYLSFGYAGMAMYILDNGFEARGYASAYDCDEYKLKRYQLNGESTNYLMKEIEVFQLEVFWDVST